MVNVVDLMRLQPAEEHPHGLSDRDFDSLFTTDRPVIFAYHGYPWLIHRLTYRRTNHANLHVRGYKEEGTTTTPFDMVVRNDLDRFHLAIDVIDRVPRLATIGALREAGVPRPADRAPALHRGVGRRSARDPRLALGRRAGRHGSGPTGPRGRAAGQRPRCRAVADAPARTRAGAQQRVEQPEVERARRRHRGRRRRRERDLGRDRAGTPRGRAGWPPSARLLTWMPSAIGWCMAATVSARPSWWTTRSGPGIAELAALAPLHNPAALAGIEAATRRYPSAPQVAAFDTAFHATIPDAAALYPLPWDWTQAWGLRRFGFHGLSVQYAVRRAAEMLGERARRAGGRPPRERLLGLGRCRRPIGGHQHGIHAAGGPDDGRVARAP